MTGRFCAGGIQKVIYRYLACGDLHKGFAISNYTGNFLFRLTNFQDLVFFKWKS